MGDKRDAGKLPALIAGIKLEPGTFAVQPKRLPSFRECRDLTLGSSGIGKIGHGLESKPKRVYTPNLNVQRNKNKSDAAIKEEHLNSKEKRDKNKNDGKGRKRDKTNNFIQLSGGVFAEGIAGKTKVPGSRGGGGGGDRDPSNNFIQKPKLNLHHDRKIEKEEEEMKLKELHRDDFLDDPASEPDVTNAPVRLPMLSLAKIKSEIETEVKKEVKPSNMEIAAVKIKQEKLDDDDEMDVKPKLENGLLKADADTGADTVKMKLPEGISVCELFESKEPQFIFLQMPDCLPGLKPEEERLPARPTASANPSSSQADQLNSTNSTENAEAPKHCTLKTLPEGCIGKLQLLKSGRARLVFGEVTMYLDMGTQTGFRQDLISVDLDHSTKGGDMINLGPVKTRMVCTPDWESMLS